MTHYLKKHPSNLFNALGVALGLLITVLGAPTNPLLLIIGIASSLIAGIALALGIRENIIADREAQQQRRAQETQIQSVSAQTPGGRMLGNLVLLP